MDRDETKEKSLSSMLEKVIVAGNITRDDQEEINNLARLGNVSLEDAKLLGRLTALIQQGTIQVS